jgi:putative tryptophan/tyrosine transport system substrate-binding protein
MKRREFITLIGGAAAAPSILWPLAAEAQVSTKRPLIGYLSVVTRDRTSREIGAFLRGLRELDYVEGRDFDIAYRFAEGYLDQSAALAAELLELKPNVIFAAVTPAAVATKGLSQTVPIVCPLLADPIRFGLIASEPHPAGNVTGVLFRVDGLAGKQLEFVLQVMPDARAVGMLVNVASGTIIDRREAEQAAQKLGVTLIPAEVRAPDDLDAAFRSLVDAKAQAAVMLVDGMAFNERERIAVLAAAARLPVIYGFRDHVDAGGLISYGVNLAANFHRAATYVVKILKGAKPGDLPVEFPTKLELVINLKTAKALGLEIPPPLLARADEVIE